jgi:uncharacterized membrane protein
MSQQPPGPLRIEPVGLAVVVPVLGHSTWHLYRKVVEPDPRGKIKNGQRLG